MKLGYLLYDNLQTEYLDKYHSFITETVKITREGRRECKKDRWDNNYTFYVDGLTEEDQQ